MLPDLHVKYAYVAMPCSGYCAERVPEEWPFVSSIVFRSATVDSRMLFSSTVGKNTVCEWYVRMSVKWLS